MPIRIAVIGAGHHGRHHARILSALDGAELIGVVDANQERAREIAAECNTSPFTSPSDVIDQIDAAIVATPTEVHGEIAVPLLRRGIAVLVEKPLARSMADADAMVAAAEQSGAVLAVGHSERHNPAFAAVKKSVTEARFIEVHRLGTFPARSLDIDVVYDLMIHDLDAVLSLVKSPVAAIEAVGVAVLTSRFDIANARIRFENGCIANLTASRISRDRVRKLRVFQPAGYISIDFAAQAAAYWRLVKGGSDAAPVILPEPLNVVNDQPLKCELTDFIAAITEKRAPLVTGEDGRRALEVADRISARIALDQSGDLLMAAAASL